MILLSPITAVVISEWVLLKAIKFELKGSSLDHNNDLLWSALGQKLQYIHFSSPDHLHRAGCSNCHNTHRAIIPISQTDKTFRVIPIMYIDYIMWVTTLLSTCLRSEGIPKAWCAE